MMRWVVEKASGAFLYGGPYEVLFDPQGQELVELSRNPDRRLDRYDGPSGIRKATAQEIADYDTAQTTKQTADRFDSETLVKALAIWTAGKLNVPLATARQEILTILRGL